MVAHYTFAAPAMPVYTTGNDGKTVVVPPNTAVSVSFKALRALQSMWISNITNPQPPGATATNTVTVKIFASPALSSSSPPDENDTTYLIIAFKDYLGYIPINQLMPNGSSNVHIIIRNHSTTDTLVVSITGEA